MPSQIAKPIPEAEWLAHRDTLKGLRLEEKKTTKEIMGIMETYHDFFAT